MCVLCAFAHFYDLEFHAKVYSCMFFFFNLNVYKEVLVNVTVFKKIKLNVLPYHKINFWLSEEPLFVSFVALPFQLICASLSSFPFLNIVIYNVSELCDVVICDLLSICLFP